MCHKKKINLAPKFIFFELENITPVAHMYLPPMFFPENKQKMKQNYVACSCGSQQGKPDL